MTILPVGNAVPVGVLPIGLYGAQGSVSPLGEMRVENPASQLFQDTFDTGTLDNTNRWTTPTTGGTGIAATNAVGATVLDGGTTANSFSKLTTQVTFPPVEPGYLLFNARINIENPVVTTAHRFWGFGTSIASPTIANPITQGVGFEIATDGKLYAVSYASGSRLVVQDLSNTTGSKVQPTDSSAHKYFIYFRGDISYWCIDDKDNVVANFQTGASGPDINTLNMLFQVVSNGGTHATIQLNAITLGDTSHTGYRMSDGVFGWRAQSVFPQSSAFSALVNTEGQRATYRYAVLGFTPVATPTAFMVIQGSATKIIRVKRIYVSGVATAAGNMPLVVTRRSTAGTLGSAALTAITAAKHDTTDGAATAVVSTVGTANYTTLGTANGQLCVDRIGLSAAGSGVADSPALYEFCTRNDKPLVLRGTADFLTLEGNGAAVPTGGVLDIEIQTEEDTF